MTLEGALGLAVGILAIVVSEWMPTMRKGVRNFITIIGFAVLWYGCILALADWTAMKVSLGPMLVLAAAAILGAGGVVWHIKKDYSAIIPKGSAPAQLDPGRSESSTPLQIDGTNHLVIDGLFAWENAGPAVRIIGDQNVVLKNAHIFKNEGPTVEIIKIPQGAKPLQVSRASTSGNPDGTFTREFSFHLEETLSKFYVRVDGDLLKDLELFQNDKLIESERREKSGVIVRQISNASGTYSAKLITAQPDAKAHVSFGGLP